MNFFTLLGKEFYSLKKNLGVLVILFLVPIFIIFIMGYAFKDTETKYGLGIINKDGDKPIISALVKNLKSVDALTINKYNDEDTAKKELKDGKIIGFIVIPEGFDKDQEKGEAKIRFIIDNTRPINASAIEGITNNFIEKFNTKITSVLTTVNVGLKLNPNTNPDNLVNEATKYLDGRNNDAIQLVKEYISTAKKSQTMSSFNQTTCGMTAMFILFLGILWGSGNILEEKLTGTMTRLSLSPASFTTIFLSKLVYIGLLAFLQFVIFFSIGHAFLNVPIGNVFLLVLINVAFILATASIGLLVSIVAKSRISAIGLSFFIIMLLSPLGGLWFPLETVPEGLQRIASILPTGSYMMAMDKIIIKNQEFNNIIGNLVVILLYFVVSFSISIKMGILGTAKKVRVKKSN
ncbi:ABC transporter permease [Clostridium sp. C8-1-8]|uniref:ABC transporter permease n=1 Tax=Clostridium sp. C8-1-8 TaxID=2698831 RepID=UPI00136DDC36|nr:ABC transporter permease [Clostridium sp. C8-1-8]